MQARCETECETSTPRNSSSFFFIEQAIVHLHTHMYCYYLLVLWGNQNPFLFPHKPACHKVHVRGETLGARGPGLGLRRSHESRLLAIWSDSSRISVTDSHSDKNQTWCSWAASYRCIIVPREINRRCRSALRLIKLWLG